MGQAQMGPKWARTQMGPAHMGRPNGPQLAWAPMGPGRTRPSQPRKVLPPLNLSDATRPLLYHINIDIIYMRTDFKRGF